MELLIILGIIGILVYLRLSTLPTDSFSKSSVCKLHTWEYIEASAKMICKECGQVAGLVKTDKGDY